MADERAEIDAAVIRDLSRQVASGVAPEVRDTRSEIAYFLEGAAFQHSLETAMVLRDLAGRIRAGDYR